METVLVVVGVVAIVLLRLVLRRQARSAGRALGKRMGGPQSVGSVAGTYVMAAIFAATGIFVLLHEDGDGRDRGLPDQIAGPILVLCGVYLLVTAIRRGRRTEV